MKGGRALVVLGTRPEAVKLFPVIRALKSDPRLEALTCVTGQHKEMVSQILEPFSIRPEADLDIMEPGQTLNGIVSRVVPRLDALISETDPSVVLVQGDTTSAFCAALAAFHRKVKVAHVEAGLRSYNRFHPYPEESNRRMIGAVADLHLAPTRGSAANLEREGIPRSDIVVTGNTGIDGLLAVLEVPGRDEELKRLVPQVGNRPVVLVTIHRRESWASGPAEGPQAIHEIFAGIRAAAADFPGVDFIYPVHRNPRVRAPAQEAFGGVSNVHVLDPLPYVPFVTLMAQSTVIVTDSGGIQEEAPSLGVPVLVARETTERPEGLECGTNHLVGTDPDRLRRAIRAALEGSRPSGRKLPLKNPFGDGKAADRTRQAILHLLGLGERAEELSQEQS